MANKQLQLRRGTKAQNANFKGAKGEISAIINDSDRDTETLVLGNDHSTGGTQMLRADLKNLGNNSLAPNAVVSFADSSNNTGADSTVRITNVATPVGTNDVATKAYVDSAGASQISIGELGDVATSAQADAHVLIYNNAASEFQNKEMTGDVTITAAGVSAIGASKVLTAMIADSNVTTAKIADSNVTTAKIADDAVTNAKLADNAVDTAELAASAVETAKIADDAVTTVKVVDNAITNAKLADDAVDSDQIVDGAVDNEHLAGSIANAKLSNSSITVKSGANDTAIALGGTITYAGTANEVEVSENSGTVTFGLPNNVTIAGNLTVNGATTTVESSTLNVEDPIIMLGSGNTANSVDLGFVAKFNDSEAKYAGIVRDATDSKFRFFETTEDLSSATAVDIADGGYSAAKIVVSEIEGTVKTASHPDVTTLAALATVGTVTSGTWNATPVATAYIADTAITTAKITDSNVTTAKLAGNAVTGAKIADDSIDSEHIVDGSIDTAHIADAQVTADKLASNAVTTVKILDANVTTAKINDDAITTAKVLDANITAAKLAADSVTSVKIADSAVLTAAIDDAAITTAKIANANVTLAKMAAASVDTSQLVDSAVTTGKIEDAAVLTAKIADANVTTAKLADTSVTTAKIAGDAVTGAQIADDVIDSEHYVDGSIDAAHLASDSVVTLKIADSNVTTAKIADLNVTTDKLAADAVTAAKLANEAVVTANIVNANVTTAKIADNAVTTTKLAADAVTGDQIANDSIDSEHYVDGSIDTAHLASDLITADKIADDVVNSEHLAAGAIDTEHIADSQVTTAKIADDAVTADKILDSAVTTAKINADAVTGAKIANDAIDSEHYVDGSIDTAHIADSQVTTAKLADDAVTTAKILDDNVTFAKIELIDDAVVAGNAKILIGDGTDFSEFALSGDVSMSNTGAVTLADNSVDTVQLEDDAVTTAKVTDANITAAKLATDSVETAKIVDLNVTTDKLAANAVTTAKITDANVTTVKIADANVTTAKIADDAVTNAKIASDAVTASEISFIADDLETTDTHILVCNGSSQFDNVAMSGDATLANTGALTLANTQTNIYTIQRGGTGDLALSADTGNVTVEGVTFNATAVSGLTSLGFTGTSADIATELGSGDTITIGGSSSKVSIQELECASDITIADGDFEITDGDCELTKGDLALTEGNITLTEGNITLSGGDILVTGNLTVKGTTDHIKLEDSLIELNAKSSGQALNATRDLGIYGHTAASAFAGIALDGSDSKWKFFTATVDPGDNQYVTPAAYGDVVANNIEVANITSSGCVTKAVSTVTSNDTTTVLGSSHHVLFISGSNSQLTVPTAVGITGREYVISNIDSSNNITINQTGSQLSTTSVSGGSISAGQKVTIISDGSVWREI